MTLLSNLSYAPTELSFGTSGLRGLVSEMTDLECYINVSGFLTYLRDTQNLQAGNCVFFAGDLRDSTPRITQAVQQAIADQGYEPRYYGCIPTPAIAYYALQQTTACIMVTGSHIPADRNGIKFYKHDGEILKQDETAIKAAVAKMRQTIYTVDSDTSQFTPEGSLKRPVQLLEIDAAASTAYTERYTSVFDKTTLADTQLVFYQHSAVGRDLIVDILRALGAEVITVGRSDIFVPIDSENVTHGDQSYFKTLAATYPAAFAILSTDGDSDRPFVIDEIGNFHRGDVLGAVVATWCQADFAAVPISSSDAVDSYLTSQHIDFRHTRIGSPYVIDAMQQAAQSGVKRVVGWEVNGGFLLGSRLALAGPRLLEALPTRDALLPMVVCLIQAIDQSKKLSELFAELPQRYTQAGLIDNFPVSASRALIERYAINDDTVRQDLSKYFTTALGYGNVVGINSLDGIRISFDNGDIAHIRPSGNAPQLRIYSVSDSQARADEIVAQALSEPSGIFRLMASDINQ